MFRSFIFISAAALICASSQIAIAEDNGAVAGAVAREVAGNDITYHRHDHQGYGERRDYNEHRRYAEHHRYHHTYVQ
jgi:hypothetical protein